MHFYKQNPPEPKTPTTYKIIFQGRYEIHHDTRLYKLLPNGEKQLIPLEKYKGYRAYTIDGTRHKVHTLMAQCFIPNPQNRSCVRHLNNKPTDNRLSNLEWTR